MTMVRSLRGAALSAALLVALAGCGDNAGNPVGFRPEGQQGEAVLILAAVPGDTTFTSALLVATIFSPPPVDGFRVYIQPGDEGFRPATETPVRAGFTLGTGWSVYTTIVEGFDPAFHNLVMARGSRDGIESSAAPQTNIAFVPTSDVATLLTLRPVTLGTPADSSTVGSGPTLTWSAVGGATSYLLQVFNSGGGIHYSALVPSTSHQLGSGSGVIFETQPLRDGGLYRWHVQALDAGNRVIGTALEQQAFFVSIPTP